VHQSDDFNFFFHVLHHLLYLISHFDAKFARWHDILLKKNNISIFIRLHFAPIFCYKVLVILLSVWRGGCE